MPARATERDGRFLGVGSRRHLVLVGGGHAHVHVLRRLAIGAPEQTRITLISPSARAVYSGMVPGRLVGLCGEEDGWIDVAALAARAGATFLCDRVVRLDPSRQIVGTAERGEIPYDLLSLDVGSRPVGIGAWQNHAKVIGVKPVEVAAPRIAQFLADAQGRRVPARAVVVGGGAGGVEVAFALGAKLAGLDGARVDIVERQSELLPEASPRVRRLVTKLAARYGLRCRTNSEIAQVDERGVVLRDGTALEAPLILWATGAEGLPFLRASGLPVDARGFLLVDEALRSIADPKIFAAGDCARMARYPKMPRTGVFAVRQGPVLARNLKTSLAGRGRLERYRPQAGFLSLLSTGDGRAVLSYRGLTAHGRLWWWLKSVIDRRFIETYAPPRADSLRRGDSRKAGMAMACGGCAAKVGPEVLTRVLGQLGARDRPPVLVGLEAADDAAVLRFTGEDDLLLTVDAFPPFFSDLFTVGEVAAVNAASDVYAMGGRPTVALALVSARSSDGRAGEADLLQLMSGAQQALERMGIALAGGHSLALDETLVGFTVLGQVSRDTRMTKGGARTGDLLVLTKALGTGVVMAATRSGECPAPWTQAAVVSMRQANDVAARVFLQAGVRTCTDVSGFGLLGHLGEVLRASGVSAELWLASISALPGALELLDAGWRSSADESLRTFTSIRTETLVKPRDPRIALLCDPQTSGGLLGCVPAVAWPGVRAELGRAGIRVACIGVVRDGEMGAVEVRGEPETASLVAALASGM